MEGRLATGYVGALVRCGGLGCAAVGSRGRGACHGGNARREPAPKYLEAISQRSEIFNIVIEHRWATLVSDGLISSKLEQF